MWKSLKKTRNIFFGNTIETNEAITTKKSNDRYIVIQPKNTRFQAAEISGKNL